jgi:hypothetical protein
VCSRVRQGRLTTSVGGGGCGIHIGTDAAATELNRQSDEERSEGGDGGGPRYYAGPYCSDRDGASIYMGVFSDLCVTPADVSAYRSAHYGADLPFSSIPMVQGRPCISCQDDDADASTANGDNDDDER